MKIFIICSKAFYHCIRDIKNTLETNGHTIELPTHYDSPVMEYEMRRFGIKEHAEFKRNCFQRSEKVISECDAVLVLNFKKDDIDSYIGGATFLEIYDAFRLNKKIYLYNPIAKSIFSDELEGFSPFIIYGDLNLINDGIV